MEEPRTKAGRVLLGLTKSETGYQWGVVEISSELLAELILAIEEEAAIPDVDRLRRAIYAVSVQYDWEHTVDREDRTEEIVAEYARPERISA